MSGIVVTMMVEVEVMSAGRVEAGLGVVERVLLMEKMVEDALVGTVVVTRMVDDGVIPDDAEDVEEDVAILVI